MCHVASLVAIGIDIVSVFINGLEVSWCQWPSLIFYPTGWDEICSGTYSRRSYVTSHCHNISLQQPMKHNAQRADVCTQRKRELPLICVFCTSSTLFSWREEGRTYTVLSINVLNITVDFYVCMLLSPWHRYDTTVRIKQYRKIYPYYRDKIFYVFSGYRKKCTSSHI